MGISQVILKRKVAVAAIVCATLLASPASADAGEPVEIETVSTVDADNRTEVSVRYEAAVTVRINTYLFGSEELQDEIVDSIGVEKDRVEFESLDIESAEILYDGEPDNVTSPS